ncbi:helix-hairpin-helix domain-containing protein [Geomicrobium sediminis]|uniref:DNA uptake protein ComE-like DNA-binding protein n=1 Tax=Geomicrobium sediminis TaxID=1347788 RepID=A0ABS2PBF5_9BACL|nr:helix-hairpin-helix domain-containing protein [Geomicrobium sediminis]MBM7632410.1 DNA uptake protein ComE-like DNA-binding protein [Geomicrobium sediminis]
MLLINNRLLKSSPIFIMIVLLFGCTLGSENNTSITFSKEEQTDNCTAASIYINKDQKDKLMTIYQIGEERAEQILDLREQKLFNEFEDLIRIDGIGNEHLEAIEKKSDICFN